MSSRRGSRSAGNCPRVLVLVASALVLFSIPYVHSVSTLPSRGPAAKILSGPTSKAAVEIDAARASIAAGNGPAARSSNGTWTDAVPALTSLPEFAYDAADGYLVVFQGLVNAQWNSTWVYENGSWTELHELAAPSNRFGVAMAYDPSDREVVLFGGFDAGPYNFAYNDTWTFAAGVWTKINASVGESPSPRGFASMTYDSATGSLILFGGESDWDCDTACGHAFFHDTWSFSKGVWHRVATGSPTPPSRAGQGMAFDPSSGNLTMFGGFYPTYTLFHNASHPHPIHEWTTSPRNDTWTFRAGKWQQVLGPVPGGGSNALFYFPSNNGVGSVSLLYVPALNGSILFGNASEGTWRFANNTWTRLTVGAPPPNGEPIAYDGSRGEAVQFGVTVASFNGSAWSTPVNPLSAALSVGPLLAYDPTDGYVLGYNARDRETWTFDNGTWSDISATTGPHLPAFRTGAVFTYDVADKEALLFGGIGWKFVPPGVPDYFALNDTWAFRNGLWTELHPTHSPPRPIYLASAAYDAHDNEVVLFGGRAVGHLRNCCWSGPALNSTWTFSAGQWANVTSAGATPPARDDFQLVGDPNAGGVVMFGGEEPAGAGNDTWVFSMGNWSRISSPLTPSAREAASMTYDSSKGEVLLFGGAGANCYSYCGGFSTPQVWAFKNGSWSVLQFGPQFVPEPRAGASFVYVPQEGYDLLDGGAGTITVNDVWTLSLS